MRSGIQRAQPTEPANHVLGGCRAWRYRSWNRGAFEDPSAMSPAASAKPGFNRVGRQRRVTQNFLTAQGVSGL